MRFEIDKAQLGPYFEACWKLFWEVSIYRGEVRGHCPVAYFGDLDAFTTSDIRVITVGLNPSHREFGDRRGERFPDSLQANRAQTSDPAWLLNVYARDMNQYFAEERNPYKGWFDTAFKGVLAGLGASFYRSESAVSQAIHTDLFSPIATDPTWSGLLKQNRELHGKLVAEGVILWRRLIDILQPDIIVASMQRDNVSRLGLNLVGEPEPLSCVSEKKGRTRAAIQPFALQSGKSGLILTGGAGRKPMNSFSPEDRVSIGKAVRQRWQLMTG